MAASNAESGLPKKDQKQRRASLPTIKCLNAADPAAVTPERVAEFLLDQEAEAFHAAGR